MFGGNANWTKWCTLLFAQLEQNKHWKKTQKPQFFCNNLAFAVKQQRPDYCTKPKKHELCTLVFLVSTQCFFSNVNCYCLKNTIFLQVCFFALALFTPFFFVLAISFVGFSGCSIFFISSCCCFIQQLSMLWLLFLLIWVSLVLLCAIFWICLILF